MNKHLLFKILTFSTLFVSSVYAQENWKKLDPTTDKLLRHVFFVDSTTGWCAGEDGIIFHTANGG